MISISNFKFSFSLCDALKDSMQSSAILGTVTPGRGRNILRVGVCAALMGGFLVPTFSKQGSPFGRFSLNKGGLSRNCRNIVKNW